MNGYQTGPSTPAPPGVSGIPGIMRRTRPWVLFLGVLSLVGVAFIVCALLVLLVASVSARETLPTLIAVPAYGLGIIFDLLLGIYLLRYASRIARYVAEPGEALLAEALEAQRVYWKFVGILAIVAICFGIVAGITAALLGFLAAAG